MDRRTFFRRGFRELLKPLAETVEQRLNELKEAMPKPRGASRAAVALPTMDEILRPPGSLAEADFLATCSRCGVCVSACPASAIKLDFDKLTGRSNAVPSSGASSGASDGSPDDEVGMSSGDVVRGFDATRRGGGAPYILAEAMPCVVCSTLECMTVCPSGALVPTPIARIDMGTAVWDATSCTRPGDGACQICVDECPIGEVAIVADARGIRVLEDGCTGCGVCQYRCPTSPRSIRVVPRALRDAT
jgi:ferredoxin-type protein NapG